MLTRLTGLSLTLTLFLAPFSFVLGAICVCAADAVDAGDSASIAPFSCCGESHHCCYGHKEKAVGTPLLADLNQASRDSFKATLCQACLALPAPVMAVAQEQNFLHAADPPQSRLRERSFFQNWLI